MGKNIDNKKSTNDDPFLTKNVWIKRLGLFILIVGIFPTLLNEYSVTLTIIFLIIIGLCILTYLTKHIIGFFKTFNY